LIHEPFKKLHEWQPDFLAIWNMNFDLPVILKTLQSINVDPKDILCDPKMPKEFRICRYKEGNTKKVTASGKVMPINPANQWHTLFLTASFYVIDAMCVYRFNRLSKPEEPSYKLDKILEKELGIRKLNFTEADGYTDGRWHQFMQTNFKIEYIVYNIFDSLSMLELEYKTKDLSFTLPSASEFNDFSIFNSGPKRIAGAFFDAVFSSNYIVAATGNVKDELQTEQYDENGELVTDETTGDSDDEDGEDSEDTENLRTLDLKGWILTLQSHMQVLGQPLIEEDPHMRTNIRGMVYDIDAVSSYPTCTAVANVSRHTTKREIISIDGVEESVFRMENINLLLGQTNSLEYAVTMFNLPKPEEALKKLAALL
jgi:hypothetical protein